MVEEGLATDKAAARKPRLLLGLMSGTSVDGVTAAIVKLQPLNRLRCEILEWETYRYPRAFRQRIFELFSVETGTVDKICSMNFELGERFAEAALKTIAKANLKPSDIYAIGSHGQTIYHKPEKPRSSLQIGQGAVIAERTGITTVCDFRARDIAAGGQGAPLLPYVDYLLFRSEDKSRAIQNIGGIANVTVLPEGCGWDEVWGFDTGPGNMIIDALVSHFTGGRSHFDKDGLMASRGSIDEQLLKRLMSTPFIRRRPPKTTGRELFGDHFTRKLLRYALRRKLGMFDIIATATAFTCRSIIYNYRRFIYPRTDVDEVVLGGGGSKSRTMVQMLRDGLGCRVFLHEDFGIPSEAKEAAAFAILANEMLSGRPGNMPRATGASRRVVLGTIWPGRRGSQPSWRTFT